jgi:hypothetical protein
VIITTAPPIERWCGGDEQCHWWFETGGDQQWVSPTNFTLMTAKMGGEVGLEPVVINFL